MKSLTTAALLACLLLPEEAGAQKRPATLAGRAVLPAATFIAPPADSPAEFATSAKYAGPDRQRNDAIGSIEGTSFASSKKAPRKTGVRLPFAGQPVQGFSGLVSAGDGRFWAVRDNGFGSRANSADAMLSLHLIAPDWKTGSVAIEQTLFLRDPDRKLPFAIVTEGTAERYLTGADLDPESIQLAGGRFWMGDEFGPFLIEAAMDGRIIAIHETLVDGQVLRSPDNGLVTPGAAPDATAGLSIGRSRGFEGLAASTDGKFLYPMLEGPLRDNAANDWEMRNGHHALRVLEFDIAARRWTRRHWTYLLEANGNAIGDFTMIDATTGLVIERDGGEGDADGACPEGQVAADCFNAPAMFKRIYKVELAGEALRKIGYIDLLKIDDEANVAPISLDGIFTFPFVTIEAVAVADAAHIIVANDNNLPFSSGREPQKQDDNEFILLSVPEFLAAK